MQRGPSWAIGSREPFLYQRGASRIRYRVDDGWGATGSGTDEHFASGELAH